MRRLQRIVSATVLIALSGALAGCGSMSNWDPMDMLDFLDTKKKLPGDRKPVFPEGVPGLEQGVPKELYKGNAEQQQQMQQQEAAAVAAPPSAEEAKSAKRAAKSKAKGKPTAVSAAPAQDQAPAQDPDAAAPEEEGGTAAVPPAPKPKKQARRRTTSLPNDDPATQPAQGGQPAQSSNAPFAAPVPSGSFQR
jgi:hypothetical protein